MADEQVKPQRRFVNNQSEAELLSEIDALKERVARLESLARAAPGQKEK